jgi:hypothetical protein
MARKPGETTLVIKDADSERLDTLCEQYEGAEKAWLGQLLLRFGIANAAQAIREAAERAAQRIEDQK